MNSNFAKDLIGAVSLILLAAWFAMLPVVFLLHNILGWI